MFNVDEFIKKVVGVKWVDRACSFSEMDCWGLVILYYKHVLGITLSDVVGYSNKKATISNSADDELRKNWVKCEPCDHCLFLAYIGDRPCHVGIVIDNHALHANGNSLNGQVQYHRLDSLNKIFSKLEFFKNVNLS